MEQILIKLTTPECLTTNNTTWSEGIRNFAHPRTTDTITSYQPRLCSDTVIHAYRNIAQAMLFRSHHGYESDYVLVWLVKGEVCVEDVSKVGCKSIAAIKCIGEARCFHMYTEKEIFDILRKMISTKTKIPLDELNDEALQYYNSVKSSSGHHTKTKNQILLYMLGYSISMQNVWKRHYPPESIVQILKNCAGNDKRIYKLMEKCFPKYQKALERV